MKYRGGGSQRHEYKTSIAHKTKERLVNGNVIMNEEEIRADLNNNWAVVAEAIQTILRREGYPKPYEALKSLTRTHGLIEQSTLNNFIDTLKVSDELKAHLKTITPFNYTGIKKL